MSRSLVAVAALLASIPWTAHAGPVSGDRLRLQHLPAADRLVFVARDRDEPLPPTDPANDPTGVPGGAVVEVLRPYGVATQLPVPNAAGRPGWRGGRGGWRWDDRRRVLSSVEALSVQTGRGAKLTATLPAGALDVSPGPVAVRITFGSETLCARFVAVRRTSPSLLDFAPADEAALADCSDAALLGPCDATAPYCGGSCPDGGVCLSDLGGGCRCALPTDPCGGTAPACNGTCPAGEQCTPIPGYPFNGCVCVGDTPVCQTSGFPTCGGPCEGGSVCRPAVGRAGNECACVAPLPCGQGGLDCEAPYVCTLIAPGSVSCLPIFCGGSYPTCGGSCPAGLACDPVAVGTSPFCFCGIPGDACDASGGFDCPDGQVCRLQPGVSAGCDAP